MPNIPKLMPINMNKAPTTLNGHKVCVSFSFNESIISEVCRLNTPIINIIVNIFTIF